MDTTFDIMYSKYKLQINDIDIKNNLYLYRQQICRDYGRYNPTEDVTRGTK